MYRIYRIKSFSFSAFLYLCGLFLFTFLAAAQDYPKEIRGYKVHKTKITVKNEGEKTGKKDDSEAYITVTEPTVEDVSLAGVTMEASAEISAVEQSGKVDFLTFKDFRVNGLKVDIEEYKNSFSFEKNKPIKLPRPIKVFVGTGQSLLGAIGEMRDPKDEWTVTGTVFVFGKFKKMGFSFKRVIPVEINIRIKNPLKNNR